MLNKKKITVALAEFIGVYVLSSVMLSMTNQSNFSFFSAFATGSAFAGLLVVLGPLYGAHLSPVITIGLLAVRKISILNALVYTAAQLAGGLAALKVNSYLLDTTLQGLVGTGWNWRIVIAEALGATVFAIGVAAALSRENDKVTRAIIIGSSLFMGILIASLGSAGIVNPVIAVATNNVSLSYIVAPILGGIVGINLYQYIFAVSESRTNRR